MTEEKEHNQHNTEKIDKKGGPIFGLRYKRVSM
jgi:hypothetical protein